MKELVSERCVFVLFGTTGDLAKRYLLPALYKLHKQKQLPDGFRVLGVGRRDWSDKQYQLYVKDQIVEFAKQRVVSKEFLSLFRFHGGEFPDDAMYERLKQHLQKLTKEIKAKQDRIIFYYSTPPRFFDVITNKLHEHDIVSRSHSALWPRVVFEKPFGHDLKSAEQINASVQKAFAERQTYRIDHYVAKSAIQNLLVFRFANSVFESLLNRKHVDHIQVTVAESLGVGTRAGYYENTGALKDMVQNHLLQILALLTMEPPSDLSADAIHEEKAKLLRSIEKYENRKAVQTNTVRAQYAANKKKKLLGYKQEEGIKRTSKTETYVALKLAINNWRWEGVPMYLRTAKRMPEKVSTIKIFFKKPPSILYHAKSQLPPNSLEIKIYPDEDISLVFNTRKPGPGFHVQPVDMNFCHVCEFGADTRGAYETLLGDVIRGDKTLFTHWHEVKASWQIIDPIVNCWKKTNEKIPTYEAGSWGPKQADQLLEKDGHEWL